MRELHLLPGIGMDEEHPDAAGGTAGQRVEEGRDHPPPSETSSPSPLSPDDASVDGSEGRDRPPRRVRRDGGVLEWIVASCKKFASNAF